MAYLFHEDKLPKLISVVPGRERTFFVNKELTMIDDMLAGVMHYVKGGSSPYHLHKNCEHFYFRTFLFRNPGDDQMQQLERSAVRRLNRRAFRRSEIDTSAL